MTGTLDDQSQHAGTLRDRSSRGRRPASHYGAIDARGWPWPGSASGRLSEPSPSPGTRCPPSDHPRHESTRIWGRPGSAILLRRSRANGVRPTSNPGFSEAIREENIAHTSKYRTDPDPQHDILSPGPGRAHARTSISLTRPADRPGTDRRSSVALWCLKNKS